jgi:hypothetical protein
MPASRSLALHTPRCNDGDHLQQWGAGTSANRACALSTPLQQSVRLGWPAAEVGCDVSSRWGGRLKPQDGHTCGTHPWPNTDCGIVHRYQHRHGVMDDGHLGEDVERMGYTALCPRPSTVSTRFFTALHINGTDMLTGHTRVNEALWRDTRRYGCIHHPHSALIEDVQLAKSCSRGDGCECAGVSGCGRQASPQHTLVVDTSVRRLLSATTHNHQYRTTHDSCSEVWLPEQSRIPDP